jgi:hypothetical protein
MIVVPSSSEGNLHKHRWRTSNTSRHELPTVTVTGHMQRDDLSANNKQGYNYNL